MGVQGKRPILALEIAVEEVFFHCAKAFLRSDTWKPETWTPKRCRVSRRWPSHCKTNMSLAELEAYYSEDNVRTMLDEI